MIKAPLTTGEIAKYCHVTYRAVLKWVAEGKLKAYRTPGHHSRVQTEDFLDFLRKYNMPVPKELQPQGGNDRKKILIVDDDKEMVKAIRRALDMENYFDVEEALDGFSAGRKLYEFRPDLVILDIMLPGVDGYEVCAQIRNDPKNRDVKIIAISGKVDESGAEKILHLGADYYLPKPFDNRQLTEKIAVLLKLTKAGDIASGSGSSVSSAA